MRTNNQAKEVEKDFFPILFHIFRWFFNSLNAKPQQRGMQQQFIEDFKSIASKPQTEIKLQK